MQATFSQLAFYSISITGFMLLLISTMVVMSILRLDRIEKLEKSRLLAYASATPAPNPPLPGSASAIFQVMPPAPINVVIAPDGRTADQAASGRGVIPAQPR